MRGGEVCGCFPTGRHYPGIAHLLQVRAAGDAPEFDQAADWVDLPIALLDVETTGRDPQNDRVIELGIVVGRSGAIVRSQGWLIDPGRPIPPESTAVHGITDADVAGKPRFEDIAGEILQALVDAIPAAYNASFDRGFLLAEMRRAGISFAMPEIMPPATRDDVEWIDPLAFARELYKNEQSRALGDMAARLGIELTNAHRATDDAEAALRVLYAFASHARMPRAYGALMQEQRRLMRAQEEMRRMWRR